jgi:very-short-patch-repair endonuclease
VARVDFAWPELRIALECDGFEFHSDRATFRRDRRRWTALTRAGWRVIVVTWADVVGDPNYVAGSVAVMLAGAAA